MLRLTIHCPLCKSVYRIVTADPSVVQNGPIYCGYCGHSGVGLSQEPERDTWELYAEQLGPDMTVGTVKTLHSMWVEDNLGETRFFNYIRKLVLNAATTEYVGKDNLAT